MRPPPPDDDRALWALAVLALLVIVLFSVRGCGHALLQGTP